MKSDTTSIADLFQKEFFYEIPEFQRPFSWDKEHFEELVDDLIEAEQGTYYFLGTIVYYPESGVRMVVDGQQRLTSLMILLACLRDLISVAKTKGDLQNLIIQPEDTVRDIAEKDRLTVRDHDMFHKMVGEEGGTNQHYDPRDFDEPSNRYIIAKTVFRQKLSAQTQDGLIKFMKFVSNKCVIIYLEADSFEEAFKLFEVVNDRGKQLRRIDLLKSYNLSPDFVPQKSKRIQLANQWDQDESSIGEKEFESLFNMLRLVFTKAKPTEDLYSEFRKKILDQGKLSKGADFFSEITDYVDLYKQIFQDKDYMAGEEVEHQFRALISIMDSELRTFEWRACVLAFSKKFDRNGIYEFCLAIEKLALSHMIGAVRKDERYADFVAILASIEKAKNPNDAIDLVAIDINAIKNKLVNEDVYGKQYEKYVLLRLELAAAELDQITTFAARTTEHVFPQNPTAGGAWDTQATPEERRKFVNKLGNLVLLSKGKNSSAGNKEFDAKKASYLAPRVTGFPRSSQVLGYGEWNQVIIEQRTVEAAELVLRDPKT